MLLDTGARLTRDSDRFLCESKRGKTGRCPWLLSLFILPAILNYSVTLASEAVDYSVYDNLLKKYVEDGKIDYLKWKKEDYTSFVDYISSLEMADTSLLDENAREAFWINAYNALTIYAVLERLSSNNDEAAKFSVRKINGFFNKIKFKVAKEELTLNDIENTKLRAGFKDPRIHFAIVCASTSCPELINTVYTSGNLDSVLDERARIFLSDESKNRFDKSKNTLYLSKIFTWFREDFINHSGSVEKYVEDYMDKEDADYVKSGKVALRSLPYDWSINIMRK